MKNYRARIIAGAIMLAGSVVFLGCGSDHMDAGGTELRSGMDKSRSGLIVVDRGIGAFQTGERAAGLNDMGKGMATMTESMADMRSGLGMMSMKMMSGCGGSSDEMMKPFETGLGEMRAAHSMMLDDDPSNDDAALVRMQKGRKSAADAVDAMGSRMSCMGHGSAGMM